MIPFQVFVSYSHKDEPYLIELEKHLSALKREGVIATWHDRKLVPGSNWEGEVDGALERADLILFLISPDFVASEYCIEKEAAAALQKHINGDAAVIPIVVRPTDWLSIPIGKIQGLPKDANPISVASDKDQAWLEVVKGIRLAIDDLEKRRQSRSSSALFTHINTALTSVVERLEIRYGGNDAVGGMRTGFHKLDHLLDGIHAGDLIFLAAAPVMDRMALLVAIMNSVFVEDSRSGLIFSLRQTKEQITTRMCAALGKISAHAIQRGQLADNDWSSLTHALGRLNEARIAIVEQSSIDINTVMAQVEKFADQYGSCDFVVIDHFEHVTGGNRADILAVLSRYARRTRVPFLLAGGLERDPSARPNKRPLLSDLGEWATLNEDLDAVIFVYQEGQYNPDSLDKDLGEFIVAKNSRGQLGTATGVLMRNGQVFVNSHRP